MSTDRMFCGCVLPMSRPMSVSPVLAEAQARLQAIRQQLGITPSVTPVSAPSPLTLPEIVEQLPAHLGWGVFAPATGGSGISTEHFRTKVGDTHPSPQTAQPAPPLKSIPSPEPRNTPQTFRLYPTLAMALLKEELTAPARIWFLCRFLDEEGRGWLDMAMVRHIFTSPKSKYRLCGKRQLRNLLHAGEGLFWHREGERLWLRGLFKVVDGLDIPRLTGKPVSLPINTLLDSIQTVRANFYASFHSGRPDRPIARDTITAVGGLSADSQRRYEKVTGIKTTANYAIGKYATKENKEDTYWQYGHAAFPLIDSKGKQGEAGACYMAWQLPNSYSAVHEITNKGNQRRINRQLTDLSMKGMTGNGEWLAKRFYENGKSASRVYNRQAHTETIYWTANQNRRQKQIWYALSVA